MILSITLTVLTLSALLPTANISATLLCSLLAQASSSIDQYSRSLYRVLLGPYSLAIFVHKSIKHCIFDILDTIQQPDSHLKQMAITVSSEVAY